MKKTRSRKSRGIVPLRTLHTAILHTTQYRKSKQIFPEKELHGLSLSFHIHASVSDLYIPTIGLPILLQENMWTDPGKPDFLYIIHLLQDTEEKETDVGGTLYICLLQKPALL
jgi:hypothetical protein